MRVISGKRKGYNLMGPRSSDARPTEDRVKESLFNIIQPIKPEAVAVDLFSCTGSIGIEFLSRGCSKVYFSEKDRDNFERLKMNLEKTRFEDQAELLFGDFRRNLLQINEDIDYIFLDPPYYTNYIEDALDLIKDNRYFDKAMIICEMDREESYDEKFDYLEKVFERKYGKKVITIYKGKEDEGSLSR